MIYIFVLAAYILGLAMGKVLSILFTPYVGSLIIDESNAEKDIFRFEFSTPPEDLIEKTKKNKLCHLYLIRK